MTEGSDEVPTVRDKRRIDPETYALREPVSPAPGGAPSEPETAGGDDDVTSDALAAELTADLQRLSAEYANYRRRVERDRDAVRDHAVSAVLADLLPVLDDVGRARQHGELAGAFKAVGEALEAAVAKRGLVSYAVAGEPFDPTLHEALTAVPSSDVDEPTVLEVFQSGYRLGDRIVRPARVVVAQPLHEEPAQADAGTDAATETAPVSEAEGES